MRLGEEVAADKVLHEAFAIDPFNVRVSNTIKVLEVLSDYSRHRNASISSSNSIGPTMKSWPDTRPNISKTKSIRRW